ncbi:hypothetical protein [Corallococcus sp. RDP092CA]|uniref:hypothetical protein n=1 Tax=Corallococcus sp. RDP092CA TaxID=3109369 RepID=UPI0035B0D452
MRFSRLLAVTAALALSPAATFAMPVQCYDVCPLTNNCNRLCGEGYYLTTCGEAGYACVHPVNAPESGEDELASTCADCATEKTDCLQRVKHGDLEEVQACMDAFIECTQLYCATAQ